MGQVRLQDPTDKLDYTLGYTTAFAASEVISGSTWSASSTNVTLSGLSASTFAATVFVTGGTVGEVVRITNTVTTNQARIYERSFVLRIEDR